MPESKWVEHWQHTWAKAQEEQRDFEAYQRYLRKRASESSQKSPSPEKALTTISTAQPKFVIDRGARKSANQGGDRVQESDGASAESFEGGGSDSILAVRSIPVRAAAARASQAQVVESQAYLFTEDEASQDR